MLTKRIIPCLDIADGRVVKGTNFTNLQDAGDPLELAIRYNQEGADELTFLDINASLENRATLLALVERVAEKLFIPFTVGGGVRSIEDMENLLLAGADKVGLNTAAVNSPELIRDAAQQFGSQFIVLSMDIKRINDDYIITTHGGREQLEKTALDWAKQVCDLGAGEILLNTIDADGSQSGFQLDITRQISDAVTIPVIASGGAGCAQDFVDVFTEGHADAALAASIFHYGKLSIQDVKQYIHNQKIPVRL